jgi:hypothetical protein
VTRKEKEKMKTDRLITLNDPDELIPIPPDVAVCCECEKPLKAQLVSGWRSAGTKDHWFYDTLDDSYYFFLFCGCEDWKPDGYNGFSCDCNLMNEYYSVADWLEAQDILLCARLKITS